VYVVTNEALARRQIKKGNLFLVGALAVFAAGFAVANWRPEDPLTTVATFVALLLGIVLWQVSLYFTRRWGPRDRQDAALAKALKGLDNRYTLVVFSAPRLPDYLLIGPLGVRVLVARGIGGTVRCQGDRWSRGEGRAWLGLLLGDPIRNPTEEARQSVARVEEHLRQNLDEADPVPVGATIVFTNPKVRLEVESGQFPATTTRDLRGHIVRLKGAVVAAQIGKLRRLLEPVAPTKSA
jgi:hypothetical protein